MLSKRKLNIAAMSWMREQLQDASNRGVSLKDDEDGVSIQVSRVQQSGTILFVDLDVVEGDNVESHNCCLQLHRKVEGAGERV